MNIACHEPIVSFVRLMGNPGLAQRERTNTSSENEMSMQPRLHSLSTLIAAGIFSVLVAPAGVATADQTTESVPFAPEQGPPPPDGGETQERGIPLRPLVTPPATGTAPLQLVGPTENITKVINSLRLKHNSLTIIVTTAPGMQLTQPVEISILYISPAPPPPGGNRLTQAYQRKFGNRIIYNDPEWEGVPRHVRMDLWITEPKPEGGRYSYSMTWHADLDPIYDISISPLVFQLRTNCDYIGNSEIRFRWATPEAHDGWYRLSFTTTVGRPVSIQQFAWSRTELSTTAINSQKLHLPPILWSEHDPQLGTNYDDRPSWDGKLPPLPGKTHLFDFNLFPGQPFPGPEEIRGNTCIARLQYRITYTLRTYPNL